MTLINYHWRSTTRLSPPLPTSLAGPAMGSNKSIVAAAAAITALIVFIVILRCTIKLSKSFYVLLGACVAVIIAILIWMCIHHRAERSLARRLSSQRREFRVEYSFLRKVAGVPTKFHYNELEMSTDHFQTLIGKGSSASVYKGILDDGTPVAVKRMEGVEHVEKEFKAEVSAIASVQHVNLVRLLGYCSLPEGPRMLVYQYVHNGSLNTWIFPQKRSTPNPLHVTSPGFSCLPWDFRYRVAIDVAKALAYLHHDCRSRILHLDVKPENILLDENFRAVVTDFGLSKVMKKDLSRVFTDIRGTNGYVAPEWFLENGISEKSDIYSYGMVLLEIVGGRRNVRLSTEEDNTRRKWSFFPKIVAQKVREGKLMELVDERLLIEGGEVDERRVRILIHVALWCIQENPNLRPDMPRVVDMLEGRVVVDNPPEIAMTLMDLWGLSDDDNGNGNGVTHGNGNGVTHGNGNGVTQPVDSQGNVLSGLSTITILSGR